MAGKPLIARFDGGQLSSDGGILVLCEVERRLGVADRLAACVADPRAAERVVHSLADILGFRMLIIAAGYEDGSDTDSLRHDPAFKIALGHLPDGAALCSLPTISRLENLPRPRDLLRMGRAMVGLHCDSSRQVPRRINQPIVVFDGEGRPVAALLRPARHPTGREVRGFLRRLVREIRSHWPRVEILLRTDSRFVVTNLAGGTARTLYEGFYCRRGQAENHIKSWKTHLAADRTSCHLGPANQLRLMLHTGAYWLMWSMRRLMPARSSWHVAQFDTLRLRLRLRLLKVAARVVEWKTKVLVHLPSACPDQAVLRLVPERLPRLVI